MPEFTDEQMRVALRAAELAGKGTPPEEAVRTAIAEAEGEPEDRVEAFLRRRNERAAQAPNPLRAGAER